MQLNLKKKSLQVCQKLWNKYANDFKVFQAIEREVNFIAYAAGEEESDGINCILGPDCERLFEDHRKLLRNGTINNGLMD